MCDTLVSVTDDGILFAKNSDRDPNEAQLIEWHAAAEHRGGARLECTWIDIAQAEHTNAIVISRPWWMWGAEMGANEHGVVIGNEAVFTRTRGRLRGGSEPTAGLLGMDLLRLGLERGTTAADAVAEMVHLLERHGQGGSCSRTHRGFSYDNSFIVADPHGAIVLETAGRSHATEKVSGAGRSISNGLTIAGFAAANTDELRSRVAACDQRRARTEAAAELATGVIDLFGALRDHGDQALPRYSPLRGALGAACAHAGGILTSTQTTSSWVADLRARPLHWVTATAAPCTSLFKPIEVNAPTELGPAPGERFDDVSLWWSHELLHRRVMSDFTTLIGRYAAERTNTESAWVRNPPGADEAFALGDALEARWLNDVTTALGGSAHSDLRPRLVRRLWSHWNRVAGIPV